MGKYFDMLLPLSMIILLYVLLKLININFVKSNYNTIIMLSILFASVFIVYAISSNLLKRMNTSSNQIIAGTLALYGEYYFIKIFLSCLTIHRECFELDIFY